MSDTDPGDDVLLMRRLREGDDLALNEIMRRWRTPLIHFMKRYLQSESLAIDLAQEAFVRVYQAREKFNQDMKFSTWIFTIAANLCKNRLRWVSRHPEISLDSPVASHDSQNEKTRGDSIVAPGDSPDGQLLAKERAAAVRDAIRNLPHDQKTALILFEYEQMPVLQISQVIGATPKAVENRLYRARQNLRSALHQYLNQ